MTSFLDVDTALESTALKVDLYELTMLQAALMNGTAHTPCVFEVFTRSLPQGRDYGVLAGVDRVVNAVEKFRFLPEQINYLADAGILNERTLDYLRDYSFRGEILGLLEGDVFFPNTPVMTVKGTFAESVVLETLILSILNHDSAVASAAARMTQAAQGRPIIEMGSRRTHEDSAIAAARACYIAGFSATSNAEAGRRYDIPVTGTSAHAFTLLHDTEEEAFRAQVDALGVTTTLLVDTYDIPNGIRTAVRVAGPRLGGIRIDSGDLAVETRKARALLDDLGAAQTKIIVSSDIDEGEILRLHDCPVDGFGVGTKVVTGAGHPTAGMVYKLVERENRDGQRISVAKNSAEKAGVGGEKAVLRTYDNGEVMEKVVQTDSLTDQDRNDCAQYLLYANEMGLYHGDLEDHRERCLRAVGSA